jgi:hypothetical protein
MFLNLEKFWLHKKKIFAVLDGEQEEIRETSRVQMFSPQLV